jgi:dephospho-CoA kinase
MPVIAITGGLGSGKSTVRKFFEEMGAAGIDTDQLAREVVGPESEGAIRVREVFGESCFDSRGRLDRKKLAEIVFHDRIALRRLESILHPLIRQAESKIVADYKKNKPGLPIFVEIPLLTEGGRSSAYDGVVLVTAPKKARLERLEESGRYGRGEALSRMEAQVSDEQRVGAARWIVDNGGTPEETKKQVKRIFDEIKGMKAV